MSRLVTRRIKPLFLSTGRVDERAEGGDDHPREPGEQPHADCERLERDGRHDRRVLAASGTANPPKTTENTIMTCCQNAVVTAAISVAG